MNMDTGHSDAINAWDFFDKIFCISLVQRPDRQKQARSQFDRIGLGGKVEFLLVDRHPTNTEAGIYESHMVCIRQGLEADADRMAIFEDDVLFDGFDPARLQSCVEFLSRNSEWDAFFFGCMVSGSSRTRHRHIIRVKYRSLSHAYALNRKFAEVLIRRPYQDFGYDDYLKSFRKAYYAVHPAFAFQSNSPSDNSKYLRLDKFRRLCGGLQRIQKGNEWFFHHIRGIIAFHVMLVLLGILWIF